MNKKLAKRLILDTVMTIIMILLMGYTVTGSTIHEILGIIVIVLITIHNIINLKWFSGIIKSRAKNLNYKICLRLIINILMIINSLVLAVTSVVISKDVFSFLSIRHSGTWSQIHGISAYLELVMISIHVGLHWKMIMNAFKKMFKINGQSHMRTLILRLLALILAAFGIKSALTRGIFIKSPENNGNIKKEQDFNNNSPSQNGVQNNNNKGYKNGSSGGNKNQNNTIDDSASKAILLSAQSSTDNSNYLAKGGKKGSSNSERSFDGTEISEGESLDDFLGKLFCTGCGKHCPLTSPQCGTGRSQAQQAESYYENNANSSVQKGSSDSSDDSKSASDNNDNAITDGGGDSSDSSLEKYLGSLFCDGCSKHCPLSSPQCGTGAEKAKEASEAFKNGNEYSDSENSSNKIIFEFRSPQDDSVMDLFKGYIPIMGLFIAGTYYVIEVIDKNKN